MTKSKKQHKKKVQHLPNQVTQKSKSLAPKQNKGFYDSHQTDGFLRMLNGDF